MTRAEAAPAYPVREAAGRILDAVAYWAGVLDEAEDRERDSVRREPPGQARDRWRFMPTAPPSCAGWPTATPPSRWGADPCAPTKKPPARSTPRATPTMRSIGKIRANQRQPRRAPCVMPGRPLDKDDGGRSTHSRYDKAPRCLPYISLRGIVPQRERGGVVNRYYRLAMDRMREADAADQQVVWKNHSDALDSLIARAKRLRTATAKLRSELGHLLRETGHDGLLVRQNRFKILDFPPNRLGRPRLKRQPAQALGVIVRTQKRRRPSVKVAKRRLAAPADIV